MEEKLIEYVKIFQKFDIFKIKWAGEKNSALLKQMGIHLLKDLLYYFPRSYEDRRNIKKICDITDGEYTVVKGKIIKANLQRIKNGRNIFKIIVNDESGLMEALWFQMPYLSKTLTPGTDVILTGKIKNELGLKMVNPEYKISVENEDVEAKILPVYALASGMTQNTVRKIIKSAIDQYGHLMYEIIPEKIIKKYGIIDRVTALNGIHFPEDGKILEDAKRRFAIEELILLEIGILAKRFEIDSLNKHKYSIEDKKEMARDYLRNLGFELTKAQKRVITEIYKDLNAGKVVNRLIQGDVGSGKTAVAVIMLIYMAENGYQGALMAPTEILAEQHFLGTADRLREIGLRVEIITSSVKGKKRENILKEIEEGLVDIVIGTHALIEDEVKFKNLGLIVIDEQHRFGVVQRKILRDKGVLANLIVMSATPIPRSLALSIYGDLDVSVIDELPPGRKPIKTKWIKEEGEKEKVYNFIEKKVNEGRQCYVVCPLIEESEKLDIKSVENLFEEMKEDIFPDFKVAMLHGRMKSDEKEKIMKEFKENKTNILVSTTVIEVGVNVPNSSIMVIEDAQRFGLAQLHQLRGRVGRGEHESYCFLIAKTDNDVSKARLRIMEKTTDGFEIAEEDLKLRKPGELFGTRQSGISDLRFADIINDVKTIKLARDEAMEYLKKTGGKIENRFMEEEIKRVLNFEWVNN